MINLEGQYFKLKRHCFMVKGINGFAIYDLYEEDVYTIDAQMGELIEMLENQNIKLGDLISQMEISLQNKAEIFSYLQDIEKMGLADFFNTNTVVEKLKPIFTYDPNFYKTKFLPLPLEKIWIEISCECNLNCIHCKNGESDRCSCSINNIDKSKELNFDLIKKIIDDAELFGCKEVHFIGGEPLIKKNMVLKLIAYCKDKMISRIILQSNLLLLDDESINFIKNKNVVIQTSIYSNDPNIHDKITGVEDSWVKTMGALKKLKKEDVPVKVLIEVMNENQQDIKSTIEYLEKMGIDDIYYNYVLANSPAVFPDEYRDEIIKTEENVNGVNKDVFFRNKLGNPCWFGKVAITGDGKVTPCIMERYITIGDIHDSGLNDLFRANKVDKYWLLNKDKIEKCKDCEYRYTCFDCRVQRKSKNDIYSFNKYCLVY